MKTFKQIIDDFLDGAKSGIEGDTEHRHSKLAINGDVLLWITANNTHIVAIRLDENVIVKSTAWETLTLISGMKYLNLKSKITQTAVIRLSLPVIKNSEIDEEYKKIIAREKRHIEALILNGDIGKLSPRDSTTKFIKYYNKLKVENQIRMDRDSLQLSVRVLAILEKEKVTNTHLLMKDDYTNFINITNRARSVLEKMDTYIQVLVTLPEIISSPKENLLGPDEHPGGDDSGPLVNY